MMNIICAIPEEMGWALVGLAFGALVNMCYKLGKIFAEMWIEYHKDDEEEME